MNFTRYILYHIFKKKGSDIIQKNKIIFHIDMNCFFVSCEIAENPELEGKPVVVAPSASRRKSIILTANYEARKYGVHSAMRLQDALRLCPNLYVVDSNMETYVRYSNYFFNYFYSLTPLVEPGSIDEAFLDVTELCAGDNTFESVMNLANKIQQHLLTKFRLPCSIGIGPNKFLAKMASDMKKPLGITILRKREVPKLMWPLPVEDMPGVGKKTLSLLHMIKIKTIGDLANFKDVQMLKEMVGETNAISLMGHANGEGDVEINTHRYTDVSSVSNSQTFDNDEYATNIIKSTLKVLINSVAYRIDKKEYLAGNITLQVKYSNFSTITRSRNLEKPTSDEKELYRAVEEIYDDYVNDEIGVRLVGVAVGKLVKNKITQSQMTIFDELSPNEKSETVDKLINTLKESFGDESISIGIKKHSKDKTDVMQHKRPPEVFKR